MTMSVFSIPLTQLQGVGPQKAEELHALGVLSVGDLLEYYPFRYEDYRLRELSEAKDGEKITVQGTIASLPVLQRYGGKSRLTARVTVEGVLVTAVWFNRTFLKEQLTPGREIMLTGKWEQRRRQHDGRRFRISGSRHLAKSGNAPAGIFRRRKHYAGLDPQDDRSSVNAIRRADSGNFAAGNRRQACAHSEERSDLAHSSSGQYVGWTGSAPQNGIRGAVPFSA